MGCQVSADQSTKTSGKERPRHVWERKEQKGPATEGINCPDCWESKYEIDKSETEGCEQSLVIAKPRIDKDRRRVEGNDVDTAHLLGNHDREGGKSGPANTRDGEELNETSDIVAVADDFLLDFKLAVDIV